MKEIIQQVLIQHCFHTLKNLSLEYVHFIEELTFIIRKGSYNSSEIEEYVKSEKPNVDDHVNTNAILRLIANCKREEKKSNEVEGSKKLTMYDDLINEIRKTAEIPKMFQEERLTGKHSFDLEKDYWNFTDFSDVRRFCKNLRLSAVTVLSDLIKDRDYFIKKGVFSDLRNANIVGELQRYAFFRKSVYQITYLFRCREIYLNRLGEFKSRLNQSVEFQSSHILTPATHRREEQRVFDSFLSQVAKRTCRDLYNYSSNYLKVEYPFRFLPNVYQFSDHSNTSKVDGYNSAEMYGEWRKWFVDNTPVQESSGYSIIRLSYWMTDSALVPIIGHEVAHRILRNIGSRNLIPQVMGLTKKQKKLGVLVRGIANKYQTYAAFHQIKPILGFEVELLCDFYSITRFGASFIYTWMIQSMMTDCYTIKIKDEFGRFNKDLIDSSSQRSLDDEYDEVLHIYIRGHLILKWLEVMEIKQDKASKELTVCLKNYLNFFLLSSYFDDPDKIDSANKLRAELVKVLLKTDAVYLAKKLREGFEQEVCSDEHYWIHIQGIEPIISESIKVALLELENQYDSKRGLLQDQSSNDSFNIIGLLKQFQDKSDSQQRTYETLAVSDASWRFDWLIAKQLFVEKLIEPGECKKFKHFDKAKVLINRVVEDYVYKTRCLIHELLAEINNFFTIKKVKDDSKDWQPLKLEIYNFMYDHWTSSKAKKEAESIRFHEEDLEEAVPFPFKLNDAGNPFKLNPNDTKNKTPIKYLKLLIDFFTSILADTKGLDKKNVFFENKSLLIELFEHLLKVTERYAIMFKKVDGKHYPNILYKGEVQSLQCGLSSCVVESKKSFHGNLPEDHEDDFIKVETLGKYDGFQIYKHHSQKDLENDNPKCRNRVRFISELELGLKVEDKRKETTIFSRVYLLRGDFRTSFSRWLIELLKEQEISCQCYISYGSEDFILTIQTDGEYEFYNAMKFMNIIFDCAYVSRTERSFTAPLLNQILDKDSTFVKNKIGCQLHVMLNESPEGTMHDLFRRISSNTLFKEPYVKAIRQPVGARDFSIEFDLNTLRKTGYDQIKSYLRDNFNRLIYDFDTELSFSLENLISNTQ